ncbi:MAG: TolC family protein [Bacteroidales bacterium]|nr:TolC family protein [Bacteroidales bacterium]
MKFKNIFLALLLSGMASFALAQNGGKLRLSLEDAQQYALEHNYALLNASLDVQKAEATKWQSIASMLPQVKAGFDYQNMCGYEMNFGSRGSMSSMIPDSIQIGSMWIPITLPSMGDDESSASTGIPMNPSGNFSVTASIAFTGAQLVGVSLSNIALEMANISHRQSVQSTKANVKSVYTSILVMEQTIAILNSSLSNMQQLYQTTLASVQAGAAEQISADKFAIQVASLRNSINSTQRTLKVLYNSLILQLGADVNSEVELTTSIESLLNVDKAANLTMGGFNIEDNFTYQLLNQSEKLAEKQLTMAWMDFTPVVSAYYQYSAKTYFGKDEGFNMTPPNMIGASLSLPLFQSGSRMAKVKSAKIDLQENRNSKQQAEDGLRVQYNQLCFELTSALESYQIQKDNLDVTQRVFTNTSEKFKYGHASNLEVTTANSDILTAQSNYIQAVMSVINAQVALENLLGI